MDNGTESLITNFSPVAVKRSAFTERSVLNQFVRERGKINILLYGLMMIIHLHQRGTTLASS